MKIIIIIIIIIITITILGFGIMFFPLEIVAVLGPILLRLNYITFFATCDTCPPSAGWTFIAVKFASFVQGAATKLLFSRALDALRDGRICFWILEAADMLAEPSLLAKNGLVEPHGRIAVPFFRLGW